MPAFWDGGGKLIVRFAPTEPGEWEFRVTSNIARFEGKEGKITAFESTHPGFIKVANGHHWMYTESKQPHLWMGDTSYQIGWLDPTIFKSTVSA